VRRAAGGSGPFFRREGGSGSPAPLPGVGGGSGAHRRASAPARGEEKASGRLSDRPAGASDGAHLGRKDGAGAAAARVGGLPGRPGSDARHPGEGRERELRRGALRSGGPRPPVVGGRRHRGSGGGGGGGAED